MSTVSHLIFRLKRKVACKVKDEHWSVKDLPPPNDTVAKMSAKNIPTPAKKQGIGKYLWVV